MFLAYQRLVVAAVVAVAPGFISASRGWWSQLLTTFAVECLAMMLQEPYTKSYNVQIRLPLFIS